MRVLGEYTPLHSTGARTNRTPGERCCPFPRAVTVELKGLEAVEHIGRIVVHPTNPDVVWVAALGALWRSNPERRIYKTTDEG